VGSFAVLGPVLAGGAPPPAPKVRTLLAVLLTAGPAPVPVERLVDELWPTDPPARAARAVQVHVSRLRRHLQRAVGERRVVSHPHGYALVTRPGELDADNAAALAELAATRVAGGDLGGAEALAATALRLWRGPSLAGVGSPSIDRVHRPALEEQRLRLVELGHECRIGRGGHGAALGPLAELAAAHPQRERLTALLMTALALEGRREHAVAEYDRFAGRLRRELGTDPGAELVELRRRIVDGDTPAAAPPGGGAPAELPPGPGPLVGRATEEAALVGAVAAAGTGTPPVLVTGPPGAGTSALAVRVAHRLRARFPGGQLYLSAADAEGRPLPAGELERRVRAAAGTAGRGPALLVVDGVSTAEQVGALPRGGPTVVLTSSSRLSAVEAVRIELGPLDLDAAVGLLDAAAPGRLDPRDPVARRIARSCGLLPLALRAAAARLAAKRHWTPAALATRLADPGRRLDQLSAGDLDVGRSVRRALAAASPAARGALSRTVAGGVAPAGPARAELVDRHLLVDGPAGQAPSPFVAEVLRPDARTP
jgi:DNA-binding SARP family transcriptional activator